MNDILGYKLVKISFIAYADIKPQGEKIYGRINVPDALHITKVSKHTVFGYSISLNLHFILTKISLVIRKVNIT